MLYYFLVVTTKVKLIIKERELIMKIVISKESDFFMNDPLPNPQYPPHPSALWDRDIENWTVRFYSLEDLVSFINNNKFCTTLRYDEITGTMTILINDLCDATWSSQSTSNELSYC